MDDDDIHPAELARGRGPALRRDDPEGQGTHGQRPGGGDSTLTCPKITYDLATQISESDLPALRSQILLLLKKFAPGPKPVRVQLCVCLAILAIQMQTWKDVLPTVVAALGNDVASHACILDFLRVLPEEVTEGRKITLSVRGPMARLASPTSAFVGRIGLEQCLIRS